jgi:rod shape-determining protein MreC
MPLGTLDRTPPPFFKQGPSALSKLMVFSALALFLMVADTRFKHHPAGARHARHRAVPGAVAGHAAGAGGALGRRLLHHPAAMPAASEEDARPQAGLQAQRANQVEQLTIENARLRKLLALRER